MLETIGLPVDFNGSTGMGQLNSQLGEDFGLVKTCITIASTIEKKSKL